MSSLSLQVRSRETPSTATRTVFLYFIQAGERGPIKIGLAFHIRSRLRGLQTANAARLTLLGVIPVGICRESRRAKGSSGYRDAVDRERAWHRAFAAFRIRGEWFAPTPDLLASIAAVRDGKVSA